MNESSTHWMRTLPLFDQADRKIIQKLLHHVVSDYPYDHPDRKTARYVYHEVREGEGIRLHIGEDVGKNTLVVSPDEHGVSGWEIVDRISNEITGGVGEWTDISKDLRDWIETNQGLSSLNIGIEYLY